MDESLKSKNRTITASDPEWEKIKDAAKKAGVPLSRWVRGILLAAAKKGGGK